MKKDKPDLVVTDTLEGERVKMGVDENSLAHIMSILTDLYSDPERAVLREYSTNAIDAHVEDGVKRPIEVTLPTELSQFLKIRDYGIGLDLADIRDIYSKYGASTKRGTNTQVGMLGVGGKSALTYTNQFSLVSVKKGVRYQVSVSRDEEGIGSMTIVDQSPTDAESGTEIVIPVKAQNNFESKARDFFQYWDPKTVLINGEAPEPFAGKPLSDRVFVTNSGTTSDYVVMGNVPYPCEFDIERASGHYFTTFVDIGAVEFTPSREALHYTKKTKKAMEVTEGVIRKSFNLAVQEHVDGAETKHEALERLQEWRAVGIPFGVVTFKGTAIPRGYSAGDDYDDRFIVADPHTSKLSQHHRSSKLASEYWSKSVWVYGFNKKFTAQHKRKLEKWMQDTDTDYEVKRFLLFKDRPPSDVLAWVPPNRILNWDKTLQPIKLPRRAAVTGASAVMGEYQVIFRDPNTNTSYDTQRMPLDEILTLTKHLYYCSSRSVPYAQFKLLKEQHDDAAIVYMSSNRIGKFERLAPRAIPARKAIEKFYDRWIKKVPKTDLAVIKMEVDGFYSTRKYRDINPRRVKDPEVRRVARIVKGRSGKAKPTKISAAFAKRLALGTMFHRVGFALGKGELIDPLDKYPLLDKYDIESYPDHAYLYMNTVYESERE